VQRRGWIHAKGRQDILVGIMAAARFLFVHGAWHGAWAFDLLRLELERRAVPSEAIDLPSLGDDATPLAEATFEAGVERIVDRLATRRNWTLVGHSLGGLYATAAALRSSGMVRSLVYVAAYVPAAGDGFAEVEKLAPASAGFRECYRADEAAGALVLDPARAKDFLYSDVAPGIAAAACTRLKPQPLETFRAARVEGTAEALKKIPRSAIVAEDDRVLPAEGCAALAERAGVPFETVAAGHCPFLSKPKRIADLLLGVRS
jgi:pimeloyl-ACP methyl ester carboxylesterase